MATQLSIIGSGNMARGIGTRMVAAGLSPRIYSDQAEQAAALAQELGAQAASLEEALEAEIVVLATPYEASLALAERLAEQLAGKIVIDISNPLNASFDGLVTAPGTSAAETIAQAAPKATVVKAFNTTFAGTLVAGEVAGQPLDVFLAGDDEAAKERVAAIVRAGGLTVTDSGALSRAQQLEALGLLGITLQFRLDTGFGTAWRLVLPA